MARADGSRWPTATAAVASAVQRKLGTPERQQNGDGGNGRRLDHGDAVEARSPDQPAPTPRRRSRPSRSRGRERSRGWQSRRRAPERRAPPPRRCAASSSGFRLAAASRSFSGSVPVRVTRSISRRFRRSAGCAADIRRSRLRAARARSQASSSREHELAIGDLPEQEVGEAELTASADEKVGVGHVRRVEVGGEALGRHLGRQRARPWPRPRRCGARHGRSRRGRRN